MAKNAKAESENQTFTAQQAEAQDEPAPVGDVSRNGLWRTWIRGRARKLSHSTQFVIAAAVILGLTMFFVGNLVSEDDQKRKLEVVVETARQVWS